MTRQPQAPLLRECPNPWCESHRTTDLEIRDAQAPIVMPSRASFEWAVACPVCPTQTPWFDTEAEAIAAWNTRPSTDLIDELVAGLEEAREWIEADGYPVGPAEPAVHRRVLAKIDATLARVRGGSA